MTSNTSMPFGFPTPDVESTSSRRLIIWLACTYLGLLWIATTIIPLVMPPASDSDDAVASANVGGVVLIAALLLGVLALTRLHPNGAGFGMSLPPDKRRGQRWALFTRATVLTVAAMLAVGVLVPLLVPHTPTTASAQWSGQDLGRLLALSVTAGVNEDGLALAVPVGVAAVLCRESGATPAWTARLMVTAAVVNALLRIPGHAWEGTTGLVGSGAWGLLLVGIYFAYKSVLPVMLGHAIFDFVLAGFQPTGTTAGLIVTAGVLVAVHAATYLYRGFPRRRRTEGANA